MMLSVFVHVCPGFYIKHSWSTLVNRHATFNISIYHSRPVGAKVSIPAYTKPKLDGSVKEILKEVREIMGNLEAMADTVLAHCENADKPSQIQRLIQIQHSLMVAW